MNHSSHGSNHLFDSSSSLSDALQAVARDLLAAAVSSSNDEEECSYYDMQLISEGTEEERDDDDASTMSTSSVVVKKVPAIRFVLAARSVVFRKMLYGDFSESQQPTIRLPYSIETLSAVVHFCSHNVIPTSLFHNNNNNNNRCNDDDAESLMDNIRLFVELCQAADFLQLPRLYDLAQEYVTHQMTRHPSLACIVLESAVTTATSLDDDSATVFCPLAQTALQIIECRPYVALHPRTIVHLSSGKLQYVLQNHAMGAGEWFLLQMLLWWHREQQQRQQQQGHQEPQQPTALTQNAITRDICQSCIKLSHIEPAQLLSLLDSPCRDFIPKDFIFDAIAKQALKASQFKVWRLDCRGRNVNDDRVLVEGAGSADVNGMYYRLSASSFFASNANNNTSKNDLYVKRELAGGQCFVYTLSRRLRVVPSSSPPFGGGPAAAATTTTIEGGTTTAAAVIANATNGGGVEQQQQPRGKSYECRIFRNKFLSHQAVRKLHRMQLEGTVQPTYQPILQILQLESPCTTTSTADASGDNTRVPAPIRRFHRVRLSDGDYHMPGTLADNCGLEPRFLSTTTNKSHQSYLVIQVQEFGLYTIYNNNNNAENGESGGMGGHAGIHVIRAKVLASGPLLRFGNPLPLPPLDRPLSDVGMDNDNNDDHATFYTAVYDAPPDHHPSAVVRIPKVGWRSEGSGVDPPPECTYIALRDHTATVNNNNNDGTTDAELAGGQD
jgi:hypothetical protein